MDTDKSGTPEELLKNSVRDMNEFKDLDFEKQYVIALQNLLENGTISKDRTGVGTKRIQNQSITIDLKKRFPILLGKKMNFKNALVEMLWIMTGKNDLNFLKDNGVNYWDSWVKKDGTFGNIYGPQMRNFGGTFDQLKDTILLLKNNPDSRRIIVDLWNPNDLENQALPCCHFYYQISSFVNEQNVRVMDLHVHQRSADCFLGVPYDFMLFGIYLEIISYFTEIPVNKIHCTFNDFHMYLNHEKKVKEYINTYLTDSSGIIKAKKNMFNNSYIISDFSFSTKKYLNLLDDDAYFKEFEDFLQSIIDSDFNDFVIQNYESYKFIPAPVAV